MDTTNLFVSEFCQWVNPTNLSASSRAKLPSALRRAVDVKLVNDDERREIVSRQLIGSENLTGEYFCDNFWVCKNDVGFLEAGSIGPGWRRGWRNFVKNDDLVDLISGFFHFAGQYVHRGRAAGIIGAIAATYNQACDFRFGNMMVHNLNVSEINNSDLQFLIPTGTISKNESISSRLREFHAWIENINGLDPYIQRAVFQYWRGTALLSSNFVEEAITALDGLTSIAALFLQERMSITKQARTQLEKKLKLNQKDAENLKLLYQLRCDFGAHPNRSKWWDFSEIYENDIEELRQTSKTLLWKLCEVEQSHRTVDPFPKIWSGWFRQNANMLFQSVWFKYIR